MRPRILFSGAYWRLGFSLRRAVEALFAAIGALWLIVEVAAFFGKNTATTWLQAHWWPFAAAGLFWAAYRSRPALEVSQLLAGRDIRIGIIVADIWSLTGEYVISATRTFDTDLDRKLISRDSLQGQFTERFYTSHEHLALDLQRQLQGREGEQVTRAGKTTTEYPVGTVARVEAKGRGSYLLALTRMNEHDNASATLEDLRMALPGLWEFVAQRGNLTRLVVPVLGGGRARIPVKREVIVREIIRSAVAAATSSRFCEAITIVVSPHDFVHYAVNIEELGEFLRLTCKYAEYRADGGAGTGTGAASGAI